MRSPLKSVALVMFVLPALACSQALAQASAQPEQGGSTASAVSPGRGFRPSVKAGVDQVLVEAGSLSEAAEASSTAHFRAIPYVSWRPSRDWEFRASVRLGGVAQRGGAFPYSGAEAELGESYARYGSGDLRVTAGLQTVLWGRVDAVSLIDVVSRVDLSRFILDELPERRRPQPMLRLEKSFGDVKLDGVAMFEFRRAVLPDLRDVWSPIDRRGGRVIGLPVTPTIGAVARFASVREDGPDFGGVALRITRSGDPVELGLTVAHMRQPLPYYRLDPIALTLTATQPFVKLAAIDAEVVAGGATWRTELAFSTDRPLTRADGRVTDARAAEWVGAVEFFPGGADTRVLVQLISRRLRVDGSVLELVRYTGVNGEVQSSFGQGRWKLGVRFASGLGTHDLYLAPRLSYVGWEPHELYVALHGFKGEDRSLGGFHRDHGTVAIGLKTRF
jgi:hypothetical protein